MVLDLALGAYADLKISPLITLRPELSADARLNIVESEERDVHGLSFDFGAKAGLSALFDFFGNGLIFTLGADYVILPEKDNLCQYIAFKAGASYRFE